MNLIKAAFGAVLSLALAVGGVAATAVKSEAHTPAVSATCALLTVDLKSYRVDPGHEETFKTVHHDAIPETFTPGAHHDAVLETFRTVDHPVVTHVVHHDAVMGTEYEMQNRAKTVTIWIRVINHGAYIDPVSHQQTFETGNTRQVEFKAAYDETVTDKAAWSEQVGNGDGVAAYDDPPVGNGDGKAAWDEQVSNKDFRAPQANHVTVLINEIQVADTDFGTTYFKEFPVKAGDTYKVIVRAWDDPIGTNGWSKNFRGEISDKCAGDQPKADVWTGEWTGTWGCGATTVDQTRKVVTTPYVLKDHKWVLDTENALWTWDHRVVALSVDQLTPFQNTDPRGKCYVPPMTKDATTVVTTAKWACNAKTAVTSSVTTTYAFVLDPKTGKYGDAVPTVGAPVAGTRDLTATEFVACPVPDVEPPALMLASTGANDVTPWGMGLGVLSLISGIALVGRKILRKSQAR